MNNNKKSNITKEQIKHIANLSRIDLREGDGGNFGKRLNEILHYVESLQELDTEGIEAAFIQGTGTNVFREDQIKPSLSPEEVLQNAPDREDNFFKTPRILSLGEV